MSTTSSTTPSGTQPAAAQASGSPVTSPTGSTAPTGATGSTGATGPTMTTTTTKTTTFEWPESYKRAYTYVTTASGLWALLLLIWAIAFHAGAAFLSYRKYGSAIWAILDFIFAAFYYPYYALVLDAPSAAPPPLIGMGKPRRR